jgi:hypothetical protein
MHSFVFGVILLGLHNTTLATVPNQLILPNQTSSAPRFDAFNVKSANPNNAANLLSTGLSASFSSFDWKFLSPVQQSSLKPLSSTWSKLSEPQKRKWISLSSNYPRMTADEQLKLHTRMTQWAALSPREREQARLNFSEVQKTMPAQQKNEKWQAYQSLSIEEKKKLAKSAPYKPPRTALAAQLATPEKLHQLALPKKSSPPTLVSSITPLDNHNLPQRSTPLVSTKAVESHASSHE